jgi:hypothetical protein
MRLVDLIPDADVLCALEPYELGPRMLPALAQLQPQNPLHASSQLGLQYFLNLTIGTGPQAVSQYPLERSREIGQAIREAWAWLEGEALIIPHPEYGVTT